MTFGKSPPPTVGGKPSDGRMAATKGRGTGGAFA